MKVHKYDVNMLVSVQFLFYIFLIDKFQPLNTIKKNGSTCSAHLNDKLRNLTGF